LLAIEYFNKSSSPSAILIFLSTILELSCKVFDF
jgi:hypothetical protein